MEKPHVLVVEDNPMNMELICDLLEADGFLPLQAELAQKAFDLLETYQPCMILMDIALPGIDGMEATRRIKANEQTRDIPVIAVTASSMRVDREELINCGCQEVVYKPIDFAEMRETMKRVLTKG